MPLYMRNMPGVVGMVSTINDLLMVVEEMAYRIDTLEGGRNAKAD